MIIWVLEKEICLDGAGRGGVKDDFFGQEI